MMSDLFDDPSWPEAERDQCDAVRTIRETLDELRAQYQGLFSEIGVGASEEAVGVG
ncbi:hypothetical protein ACFL5Q_03820 [Planctomycetota bacterium]